MVGLAGSTLALLASLPSLTEAGGMGLFVADLLAHAWVLVILTLAVGSVRTLRFPAFAAVGFAGFFGMFGLSALVGRPLMSALEQHYQVGSVVVMPVLEEVLKVVPALIMVLLARRREIRPSATDIMLLGAWSGAGFALHENALFGRGGFNFESPPVLTVLFPVMGTNWADGVTVIGAGHLLWSALIALGLGIGLLYRGGRWNWIAIPVTIAAALGEHAVANAFADGSVGVLVRVLHVLLLGGGLSTLLLVAGTAVMVLVEWNLTSHRRMTRLAGSFGRTLPPLPSTRVPLWMWLTATEGGRRGRVLGVWQTAASTRVRPKRSAEPAEADAVSATVSQRSEGQK
ncbi:PrsW family glutamic-type intramembrane protease [Promicromonospora sp. NPDC060271]|uniref:PrsW family glutamic-type intramembrane protease n=1 Tax=Promicromonospora sp. NPDC060271 TaxID=3347089 RepID=UPI0036566D6E